MADLRENAITLLSSTVIDAILDVPTVHVLYTCPPGKQVIVDHVLAHSNTDDLTGMDDMNFGGGAAGVTPVWLDAGDLSSMSTALSALKLVPAGAVVILDGDDATAADRAFAVEVVAGSTGAANVTLDVFGYLIDS
jgi:hypothetical protein